LRKIFAHKSFIQRASNASWPGPAQAGAGPNARSRHGAPLSSDFMMSSCSLNHVTIVVERRCKALTRELSTFAKVR